MCNFVAMVVLVVTKEIVVYEDICCSLFILMNKSLEYISNVCNIKRDGGAIVTEKVNDRDSDNMHTFLLHS